MKRSLFNYECPEHLIAQSPTDKRENSRLLVYVPEKKIEDHYFFQLPELLKNFFSLTEQRKLLLIKNNSYVYPARIRIRRKSGARGEVFLLELGNKESYSCLLRPKAKLKIGESLFLDLEEEIPIFEVTDLENPKVRIVQKLSASDIVQKYGEMPLPPYIKRDPKKNEGIFGETDKHRYQNVYANQDLLGSQAAPTAGLHFSEEIVENLKKCHIETEFVTLHVGLGTFSPVVVDSINDHIMHEEQYFVHTQTVQRIQEFILQKNPIIFVGTTSLRTIESFMKLVSKTEGLSVEHPDFFNKALSFTGKWHKTNIFIKPKDLVDRYCPAVGDGIITNFHLPESTLVMLISALVGYENWKKIYDHAVKNKYRFFSYGDSSLLLFNEQFKENKS